MADDGNYSVQVIQEALKVWNLNLVPLTSPEMAAVKQDPLYAQPTQHNTLQPTEFVN